MLSSLGSDRALKKCEWHNLDRCAIDDVSLLNSCLAALFFHSFYLQLLKSHRIKTTLRNSDVRVLKNSSNFSYVISMSWKTKWHCVWESWSMRVKIQIIAQLKYVHSSLLRSNIILKLACKTFPKEKSEITNFVSFAYGRCSDRLAKKTLIKKGLYSSDF